MRLFNFMVSSPWWFSTAVEDATRKLNYTSVISYIVVTATIIAFALGVIPVNVATVSVLGLYAVLSSMGPLFTLRNKRVRLSVKTLLRAHNISLFGSLALVSLILLGLTGSWF